MMHLLPNSKALLLMTDRGANYKSRRIWMAFNFTVCTFFFFNHAVCIWREHLGIKYVSRAI